MNDTAAATPGPARQRLPVLLAVAGLGVSAVMTQLALMREMLSTFAGNEMVLGILLGNWLLLTGLGAGLGRRADRWRVPVTVLFWAQVLVALLPLAQVCAVRLLRNVVFLRGAAVGVTGTVTGSFVLLLPYCLVSGVFLTLTCAILARTEGAPAIGRVYVADSAGSIAGGVLFSFVLLPWFDHFALLCFPAVLNLALAGVVAWRCTRRWLLGTAAALLAGIAVVALFSDVDRLTTARQFAGQTVVFAANSPYGRLVVTQTAGQYTFFENGVPFLSTHSIEQVEETVHYALAQRPDAARVLLVSGGISGTAREVLKYGVREVTYVELDPLLLAAGRRFLPEALDAPRIRVVNTDGRLFVKRAAGRFEVVIVDLPDPSTSQLNRFYTAEFFAEVREVLAPEGVLCFALGQYQNFVSPELARLLASAHRTLRQSFTNVLVLPGGRVFFLASDGPLHADIAARLEQGRIATRFVTRHYLDAMLTPDRLADLARATTQPAAVNRDFNPVLYLYHLRHWLSQFELQFGPLQGVLLALLALYLVRLRAVPLVVFAGGFAASALEVVVLLGFQILCGSVYRQLGVIVTVFMAGLAAGALAMNRRVAARGTDVPPVPAMQAPPALPARWPRSQTQLLTALAFALAVFAGLLPAALRLLNHFGNSAGGSLFIQVVIGLLTFLLAALVGMEFPLASRFTAEGAATTASRLYTADFVGACLGALLASTLLIPLLGVTVTCLLTAGLNVVGGLALFRRAWSP